jgi:hypothetical protein
MPREHARPLLQELAMHPTQKRLDEMNRLADMGYFPVLVHLGASCNILITLVATWFVEPYFLVEPWAPIAWIALVLALNLTPVVLLRWRDDGTRPMSTLESMDFFRDQHRFSDWVYVAASANMAFWVLAGWALFAWAHTEVVLVFWMLLALVMTISPILMRRREG